MKLKISLFVLFINLNFIYSQSNCDIVKVFNDEVKGETSISTESIDFKDFTLYITAGTRKGTYPKMIFKIKKDDCIDVYQNIYLLFENEKRIKAGNYVFKYNCSGATGFIINNSSDKTMLLKEQLKSIRLDSRTTYYQIDLTKEEANLIQSYIECIFNRSEWESKIKYKGRL